MMTELIDRVKLKGETRDMLSTAQVCPKAFTALYLGLTVLLSLVDLAATSFSNGEGNLLTFFVSVLTGLTAIVLEAGYVLYCMEIRRGQRSEFLTLFDGFSFVGKIIALQILIFFFVFLWTMLLFVPDATRLERIGYSFLGAGAATLLIYGVAMIGRRRITSDRMVLAGMAISTLFGSVTTAIMLKGGLSAEMMKYSAGSSANTLWLDIAVAGPFFIVGFVASILLSRSLTVLNLGEDVSRGLGANVKLIKLASTVVVLMLSAVAVIIIGPVGYVGLMVPHIVRYFVGTDYRLILPSCAVIGSLFVVVVDLLARVLIAPREFPIGLLITMVGVPFFIFISRRQKNDTFAS